ncbi:MAG: envelope stress response membrane protein PspB [Gammaproteobacteria bacterium]
MDFQFVWYLSVPLILFFAFVAPLWLVFHYLTKWKQMKQENLGNGRVAVDKAELSELREKAARLENRLHALEKILDEESPDWRNQ